MMKLAPPAPPTTREAGSAEPAIIAGESGVGARAIGPSSRQPRTEVGTPQAHSSAEPADPSAKAAAARAAADRAAELRAKSQEAAASRLDARRVSELHGALVAERRRLNQPGKVSMEALGESLRETETKLKRQYAGKNIDFRVVVKDGKAMVKPVIG